MYVTRLIFTKKNKNTHTQHMMDWLDKVLRRIGNISAMKRRWLLVKCDQFNFKVSQAALTSLLFIEIQ